MGGITSFAKKVISWIGDIIEKVVSWWSAHKREVNEITYNYIIINMDTINQSDNKEDMVKAMAARKEQLELNKRANRIFAKLSPEDQQRINQLLDKEDY